MPLSTFLKMDTLAAARFTDATAGRANRLDPVLVRGGPHQGSYFLPERVKNDPAHADLAAAFAVLTVVGADTALAFPAPPED